jgi:hypothetical protein
MPKRVVAGEISGEGAGGGAGNGAGEIAISTSGAQGVLASITA